MEASVRVTPLGDIHASLQFHQDVLVPFGQVGSDVRVDEAVKDYASNLDDASVNSSSAEDSVAPEFLDAWEEEFGVSFDETRRFVDLVEDLGIRARRAILMMPLSSLMQTVAGTNGLKEESARALIETLSFHSRKRWHDLPEGFSERDRQPWRFRRRLSILRRPILRIDELADSTIIVAPGILRDALAYMTRNFYQGSFPGWQLKPGMARWFGISRGQRQAFNRKVADRLAELGWNAECDVKVTQLLKVGGLKVYGDVDVLAWSRDRGRVLIIECKDLQYQKTDGEIAEQLADFRGELRSNGKPDDLLKHLNRVEIISKHMPQLMKYVGLEQAPKIESHLVFKNPVPMQFAWERMRERVQLSTFAELDRI